MRRLIAALGALAAFAAGASLAVPGRAGAADPVCSPGPCLVVHWHGSVPDGHQTFNADDLANMITQTSATYPLCLPGCPTPPALTNSYPDGTTVRSLINYLDAGFLPESVQQLTLTSDTGKTATLSTNDLRAYTDPKFDFLPFGTKDLYPLLYQQSGQLGYIRPQRSDGDPNATDQPVTLTGGEMDVDITVAGSVLRPTIKADHSSVDVGDPVTFTAGLPDPPGGTPSYLWTFGDGKTATTDTASVIHRYTAPPGTHDAYVEVTDGVDTGGKSTSITIKVGHQPTPTPTTGSGSSGNGTATSGPPVGPQSGSGIHVGGGSTSATEGPTVSPTPTSGAAASTPGTAASSAASASASTSRSQAPGADDGLQAINGVLLNPNGETAAAEPQQNAGDVGAAPAARAGSVSIGRASSVFSAVLIAAVLALIVLGAVSEWRRPSRGPRRRTRS